MLEAAKIIHFLSLAIGLGGSAASLLLGVRMVMAPADARPTLMGLQKLIGRIAFAALILLWLTGLYMLDALYGGWTGMGSAFWLKIAAVAMLTLAAGTMQILGIRAQLTKTPPPRAAMMLLGMTANASAALAVVFAVLAFG